MQRSESVPIPYDGTVLAVPFFYVFTNGGVVVAKGQDVQAAMNLQQKAQALQIAAVLAAQLQQFGILRCHQTETQCCLQALRLVRRMEQTLRAVSENPSLLDMEIGQAAVECRESVEALMTEKEFVEQESLEPASA